MNEAKKAYAKALGLYDWKMRKKNETSITMHSSQEEWKSLQKCVAACTACSLHQSRTQTVFGVGDIQASLMIIGEAPGFYEDQQGEPFVGRAGQLLNAMLKSIGLVREAVYIANVLKCRPPKNRAPERQEVALCTPYLDRQITLIQPRLLLALGRVAAHYLLKCEATLSTLRQQIYFYQTDLPKPTPLIVTYHPAYLLRNPADKVKAHEDLKRVKEYLTEPQRRV